LTFLSGIFVWLKNYLMTIVSLKVGGSLKKVVGMTVRVLLHLLFFSKKDAGPRRALHFPRI
jgi:hypothetical protein